MEKTLARISKVGSVDVKVLTPSKSAQNVRCDCVCILCGMRRVSNARKNDNREDLRPR